MKKSKRHTIDRRAFLQRAGISALGLSAVGCLADAAAPADRPNVLFISIEDLNDWVGCLGGYEGVVHTPNLDRLAKRGVLFTNAHAVAAVCNPARTAVMTGIRPSTSGIYLNEHHPYRVALPDAVTLPQHFKENGYHTVGINKIFHGRTPEPLAWDIFERRKEKVHVIKETRRKINRAVTWAQLDDPEEDVGDVYCASLAGQYLNRTYDKPFFLGVGFDRPHDPWFAPKRFYDMYPLDSIVMPTEKEDDLNDVPPIGRKLAEAYSTEPEFNDPDVRRQAVRAYLANVSFIDSCVGTVLDALDTSAHADNTIVLLWSDHGTHVGSKSHWSKMTLWEESSRVPFIIAGQPVARPGQPCNRVVSLLDIYPTLADLCGLPPVSALEGQSLRPLLGDPAALWDSAAVTTHGKGNHAVRTERWRYIRYNDGTEELYDHENDPREWTNLAKRAEHASVKKELAERLPKINADTPAQAQFEAKRKPKQ